MLIACHCRDHVAREKESKKSAQKHRWSVCSCVRVSAGSRVEAAARKQRLAGCGVAEGASHARSCNCVQVGSCAIALNLSRRLITPRYLGYSYSAPCHSHDREALQSRNAAVAKSTGHSCPPPCKARVPLRRTMLLDYSRRPTTSLPRKGQRHLGAAKGHHDAHLEPPRSEKRHQLANAGRARRSSGHFAHRPRP